MNEDFMNFLIDFIKYSFEQDANFSNINFEVSEAFDYNNKLSCPQIAIQVLDDSENERYTSFEAENVSNFGIQLNVFAENMEIAGKVYTAREACVKIIGKLKQFMIDLKFKRINTNILRLVRTGTDYTNPYDNSGQIYVSVLRYNSQIVYPYNISLENLKGD